jgi:hypothetical protein
VSCHPTERAPRSRFPPRLSTTAAADGDLCAQNAGWQEPKALGPHSASNSQSLALGRPSQSSWNTCMACGRIVSACGLSTATDWPSAFLGKFSATIIFSTCTPTRLYSPILKVKNRLSYLGQIVFCRGLNAALAGGWPSTNSFGSRNDLANLHEPRVSFALKRL